MSADPQTTVRSYIGPDEETAPNGWSWSLLRGFRDGATAALREVYRLHVDDVARHLRHGFAFTSGGRAHRFVGYRSAFDLHDALHETFRRAFEPNSRQRYDGLRPYGPYLRAIARNVVLRSFRAREVQFPVIGDDPDAPSATEVIADENAASAEQELAREEIRALVQAFLAALDDDDRRLLEVRFVHGKSQRDAAAELGLGRQQVRGREAKLRKRLVAYLRARGEHSWADGVACLPLLGLWTLVGEALR